MKKRDIIFYLFLQIILALALLMLSMNAQASSNTHRHNEAVESGHHEFISGAEEQVHEKEVLHGERAGEDFEEDTAHETHGVEEHPHHGEESRYGEETEEHIGKDEGHEANHETKGHSDHDHQAEVPLVYLFYWGILILVMVIILIYFVYRRKNKKLKPMIPLAVFLVLFAIAIYVLEIITPAFSGRFDPKTLTIIHDFHEAPDIGFLRFIYKFILGILMTLFAFLNLDRNEFNKKSMEDQG
ncbi:MAG: hypothetical protein ACMUIU_00785 [bacterium]